MNFDYKFGSDYYNYYGDIGVKSTKYKIMAQEQSQSEQPGKEYLMTPEYILQDFPLMAVHDV